MTAYEILKLYKRNLAAVLFTTLQIFCCLVLLTVLLSNTVLVSQRSAEYADVFDGKEYYLLTDNGDETGAFQAYLQSPDGFDRLNAFLTELRTNQSFAFISTVMQPMFCETPITDDTRFSYYDQDVPFAPDGGNQTLKCVQLSSSAFDVFHLKVTSGTMFTGSDYTVNAGKTVPVLLGAAYRDLLQTGDTFAGNFAGLETTFAVQGFLDKNAIVVANGGQIALDYYIVVPGFEQYENVSDSFKKFNLSQQANGAIVSDRKEMNLTGYVNRLVSETGTLQFTVSPVVSDNSEELKALSKDMAASWIFLSAAVSLFLAFTAYLTLYDCLKSNFKVFAIHCCCGAGPNDITKIINGFLFSVFLNAAVLALCVIQVFCANGARFFAAFVPMIAIILFIIVRIVIVNKFNRYSISLLLKE